MQIKMNFPPYLEWELETSAVGKCIWLAITRIRHRIDSRGKLGPKFAMAEEAAAIAFSATSKKAI